MNELLSWLYEMDTVIALSKHHGVLHVSFFENMLFYAPIAWSFVMEPVHELRERVWLSVNRVRPDDCGWSRDEEETKWFAGEVWREKNRCTAHGGQLEKKSEGCQWKEQMGFGVN